MIEALDQLVRDAGADPAEMQGALVREIMHTALKMVSDGSDIGELKLMSRSLKELRYALNVFRKYQGTRKISIFGSARTPESDPAFQHCVGFARDMSEAGWMVITGAGGGIMHAGHGGAGKQASFGVSIRLPFETVANAVIKGDPKLITFRYFFTRKIVFLSQAHAVAAYPGGFGTQDEAFEVLTLIQTGKAPIVPVLLLDEPQSTYWPDWQTYVDEHLLDKQMISPEDKSLYTITSDIGEAVEHVRQFYRRYHSQRFVKDKLVLRMNTPLRDRDLDEINSSFADVLGEGRFEQGPPLPREEDYLDLPRLIFTFEGRKYGRLRELIDRINTFEA